jgi:hypothetical protein
MGYLIKVAIGKKINKGKIMTHLEEGNDILNYYIQANLDISEHLSTLKRYSSQCNSVLELGVRFMTSSLALLLGTPKEMISVDIVSPTEYLHDNGKMLFFIESLAKEVGTTFQFIKANDLDLEFEGMFDLVFIDTDHTSDQLRKELNKYAPICNKWIILHDTVSCRDELKPAIEEFLMNNHDWKIEAEYLNNNGLMVLEKYA